MTDHRMWRVIVAVTGALLTGSCGQSTPAQQGSTASASPDTVAIATQRASAASPVPGTPEPVTIPVGFQGRWGVAVKDCDPSNPQATGGLTLGERSVATFDAPGTPNSVAQPVPLTMTTELSFHKNDRSWTEATTFRLIDGGTTLERRVGDIVTKYRRCPV